MKKLFAPNEQRREDVKAISALIAQQQDGARLSWLEVEQGCGVTMDARGRNLFRDCASKALRPYLTLRGFGVEFSSSLNALEIERAKLKRVHHSISNVQKTTEILAEKHLEQMSASDKAKLITI